MSQSFKESIEKRQDIFDKYRDQDLKVRESMRNEMQSIGDETHAQITTILTNEQMEELTAIKEKKRARMDRLIHYPGTIGF